jgi:hypothetical protein
MREIRRPWFGSASVDPSFFDAAPVVYRAVFAIPRPAGEVWAGMVDGARWCRSTARVTWTSPTPHGVGSARSVRTRAGLSEIKEMFLRWEEGRRMSFFVSESTLPFFRRLAEDYVIEPAGPSSCELTWTIAVEPTLLGRLAGPVNRALSRSLFRDTRRHFCATILAAAS